MVRRPATFAAAALFLAYAIFVTWPLATDLGGLVSAPTPAGDLGGAIGHAAQVVEHRIFPFAPATLPEFDAPFGSPEPWVLNWATLPGTAMLYGLSYVFGAIAGHGIFLLLGFVLSGTAMFLLCRHLFGNTPVALLAGFVFAFHPFAIAKTEAHTHFVHGWVLVLAAWRMLELARDPSVRNGLLAGAATTFAMWFTPYFVLIAGVEFAALALVVVATLAAQRRLRSALAGLAAAVAPMVVFLGGAGILTVLASGEGTGGVRTQPIEALYAYSARVHEFVLPDRNNLLFGDSTVDYLTRNLHGSNFSENSIYLGLSVLALAVLGALVLARLVWRERREAASDAGVVAAVAGAVVAVVGVLFSAPPKVAVLGVMVPMPSLAVFEVTTTFRVFTRFVVLIELGLALLLAFGLARLLRGRGAPLRAAVVGALAVVLVLDLWARPEVRAVKADPIDAYVWLKDNPGGGVVDYPIQPASSPGYAPLFWQQFHDHPVLQGYVEGSESESRKLELKDPTDGEAAADLAALGVKYAVVHSNALGPGQPDLAEHGFRLRLSRPDASIWEVTARPRRTQVDALDGFAPPEGDPDFQYRWMGEPAGIVGAYSRVCSTCSGEVRFTSASVDVPRTLTVRDDETGRVLSRTTVPPGPEATTVRVPVRLRGGEARLRLTTDVPPAMPAAGGDPRTLSVMVQEPRLRLDR